MVQMFHTLGLMKNRIARSPHEMEGNYRIDGEKEVLRAADRVVVATPAEQSQLEFLYDSQVDKLVTIPPGVDTQPFFPLPCDEAVDVIGTPCEDRMILFVGRIEPLKGIDTLIRALAYIKENNLLKDHPHYLTVIGGDPDLSTQSEDSEMARLQSLCRQMGLDDMVVFLGKRSQTMLPYYYSAAEMLVMPSHYESFGMVALEAMACGTPVIASAVGGLAFLVQDGVTGYVVPDDDHIAMAGCITRLIAEPGLRDQLGKQAHAYAQDYAWANISKRVLDVYQDVLTTQKNGI